MTRDEFEKVVQNMKAEGVPLTVANIMVRTELPRAQIEAWLAEMDAYAKAARKAAREHANGSPANGNGGERSPLDVALRVAKLQGEILRDVAGNVAKKALGLGRDGEEKHTNGASKREDEAPARRSRKNLATGAMLGMIFGPIGLLYAAPFALSVPLAVTYAAFWIVAWKLSFLLFPILPWIMTVVHAGCAVAGAMYVWRFNRAGKRGRILPG